jgi:predicted nucleic acid-binding protein
MNILADANAVMVVILEEKGRSIVLEHTKGAKVFCPDVVSFEVANGLTKLFRAHMLDIDSMQKSFTAFEEMPITQIKTDIHRALDIAGKYNIYAYDAFYLEMAERLSLPLLTLDSGMQRIARKMKIELLEDRNANL